MQILIHLHATTEETKNLSKEAKKEYDVKALGELITKLDANGFRINTLSGNLIYDIKKHKFIDCGEPGDKANIPFHELANIIRNSDVIFALIFTKEKYLVFNEPFAIIPFFRMNREVGAITLHDCLKNFDELVLNRNQTRLEELYHQSYHDSRSK